MQRSPTAFPRLLALAPLSVLVFWSAPAHAQDQGQDQDHVVVGLGASYGPAYDGADTYRVMPIPAIDVKKGRFFANFHDGVGLDVLESDHLTVGAGLVYMPGYRQQDVPKGVDRLKMGVGGRVFASLKEGGFVGTVGITQDIVGGTKGLIADTSLSYPISVTDRFTVIPSIGASWANGKYNDGYFGVDRTEATASGLAQFQAGSGFKDASAMLTLSYRLTDRINLGVTGGVTSLLGDDQNSPLVVHKTGPMGFFSLSYRLGR